MKFEARLGDASYDAGERKLTLVCELAPFAQRAILDGADILIVVPLGPVGLNGPALYMQGRIGNRDPLGGALPAAPSGPTKEAT